MGKTTWCLALVVVIGCGVSTLGETRRGIVLAENGSTAKGAHVWAVKLWSRKLERVESTADDQGRFSVTLGPGEWLIHASLGDQGLADRYSVSKGHASRPLILRLTQQGRLRVRLVEAETGKPIVGGRLVIDNGLDPITDQDGRLEVGGIDRAQYHESFVVAAGRERKRVLFERSERPVTDLEIAVPRGGKAVGRVVDLNGNPIPRAFVGQTASGMSISLTGLWVQADDQGRFEYDGLVLDRTTSLNADAEGFEGAQRDGVRADSGGGPFALEFRLAPNPAKPLSQPDVPGGASSKAAAAPQAANRRNVSGLVLDADKKPVTDATVRWGKDRSDETIETKTDSAGRFRLSLVPDRPELISVIPENADLAPETPRVQKQSDQEVEVVLPKGHTAKGVVCDDRGTPFAGVTVLPRLRVLAQGRLALWERGTQTDAEGRFIVRGLPEMGTTFTFLRNGVSDLRDQVLELDKENIVTMAAAGAIRGKVVDHEGKPVRNFRVLLNVSRQRKPDDKYGSFFVVYCVIGLTYTSDDGSFVVRNLIGGSVQRVTVLAPGHGEGTIDRVIAEPLSHLDPGQALTFRLARPYSLKVHAVEELSGKPVPNARVVLIYGDLSNDKSFAWGSNETAWGDSVHARTDAQGVATFSPLSFSEATVLVQVAGYARQHIGWRDGSAELTAKLSPEAVVAGELLDATTGKPLDGVFLVLSSPDSGQFSTTIQAGDAGRFRIGEIPGGTYSFSIRSQITSRPGPPLHREMLRLEPGQHIERKLRLTPAGR